MILARTRKRVIESPNFFLRNLNRIDYPDFFTGWKVSTKCFVNRRSDTG